ncbi:uncharacterized protein LOC143055658 [Mytilus galloprovincialis]|uniref:uncharacterized protein LOC143055658 n=1 Tax=Mytilus galloprovincialis TaxID=29158 RepID=UPI003F7BC498
MMACSSAETEPVKKKRKTGRDDSDIFDEFHSKFLTENPSFVDAVNKFKQEITALGAYEIGSCNAADPDNGYCFTKADCTLKPTQRTFAFGNLFIEAFKMLKNFITKKEIPTDSQTKMTLELLVKFLLNEEIQEGLSRTKECDDETELTVLLAFHLFSQLSTSPYFTIDNRKANQIKVCPCRKRHGQIVYGDTSIGNLNVWHGYLDLIMEGADVIIDTIDGEQETYKDVESAVEVNQRHFEMNDNSAGSSLVQVAAKTIVYSFYYKQVHPDHSNTLIPCIGVSHLGLIFYFYDSVNDVLLGSTHFPLAASSPFQLSFTAVIGVWLILNHKHLCNGLSLIDLKEVPKARFTDVAKSKIDIYKRELKRGQVGTSLKRFNVLSLDPLTFVNSKFFLSPELEDL